MLLALPVVGAAAASGATPTVAPACAAAPTPGNQSLLIGIDTTTRVALLHVPAQLRARHPVTLVIALHGVGGTGPKMETYSGFSRVADRHGFIVAYPSSAGPFWNSTAASGRPDDVRFIGRLIGIIESRECVDRTRVFLAGVSNGGGMAALAGCALSTNIAGIASVAGGYDGQPACHPQRPLSVLEVHGTSDQIVPYFGRTHRPTPNGLPPFVNQWVARDRCRGRASVSQLATRATALRWSRCAGGVRVEHIRVLHGRHQWPGATPPDPGPPSTFCAACEIWRFFASLGAGSRRW